jgi:hypothetical protein
MDKIKIDIRRQNGKKDDAMSGTTLLIVLIDKDEEGKPLSMRTQISGEVSPADLLVMARAALEQVERTMQTQFGRPGFNVGQAVAEMMSGVDMLDSLDTEAMTPN